MSDPETFHCEGLHQKTAHARTSLSLHQVPASHLVFYHFRAGSGKTSSPSMMAP